jgi:methylglutaconyl-CoA hydratase
MLRVLRFTNASGKNSLRGIFTRAVSHDSAIRNTNTVKLSIVSTSVTSCRSAIAIDAHSRCNSTITKAREPQILMENIHQNDKKVGGIVTKLTLNRPTTNAMGKEFVRTLQKCLDKLEVEEMNGQDQEIPRCVVITSCSQKVFSAGADLKERATMTQDEASDFVSVLRSTMERISLLPMPVLCAVEGVALGGGLELALAADMRIAGANALLGFPETSLAIVPGAGGTQRLPRLIGASRAKELIWTARKLSAEEALKYGLITEIVAAGDATTRTIELGFQIATHGPIAIRASKQAIDRGLEHTMHEALEIERQCYEKVLPTQDRLEGLEAFIAGRDPHFKGL